MCFFPQEFREFVALNFRMFILTWVYAGTTNLGQALGKYCSGCSMWSNWRVIFCLTDNAGANALIKSGATEACEAYMTLMAENAVGIVERMRAFEQVDSSVANLKKVVS